MQLENLLKLNYPEQTLRNGYYTAQPEEGVGVSVAHMTDRVFIQFFPWNDTYRATDGHGRYAAFITAKATQAMAQSADLFKHWPYLDTNDQDDLLTIKCLIEDGLNQIGELNAADDQEVSVDPATGKAVE